MTFDAVYLSPHLDDAVLSCGAQIHARVRRGERIAILTVFAGDLPDDPKFKLLQKVYRQAMGLDPTSAMAARRAEDETACARLGAEALHWRHVEALGRHESLHKVEQLFKKPPKNDGTLIDRLSRRLVEFAGDAKVVVPLGAGSHMDHQIVRAAAEKAFGLGLWYYEDMPYATQKPGSVKKALGGGWILSGRGWASEVFVVTAEDLDVKIEAALAYGSQLEPLFGSGTDAELDLKDCAEKIGGERLWQRS